MLELRDWGDTCHSVMMPRGDRCWSRVVTVHQSRGMVGREVDFIGRFGTGVLSRVSRSTA